MKVHVGQRHTPEILVATCHQLLDGKAKKQQGKMGSQAGNVRKTDTSWATRLESSVN